ncbi:MAG: efflux RND transporter periplasmic adaptor subunit [Gallionella sp.]|nr:efflux RND transporter periplasmic adaptor subunit [Gallionella sp.]
MNKLNLSLVLLTAFALAACSPNNGQAPAEQGASSIAITHYTDSTELFVEFKKLVKGEQTSFAAHTTLLNPLGFQAVTEGKMIVVLSGGGQPEERAEGGVSAAPGIFRIAITPKFTGKRHLSFQLLSAKATVTHELGVVEVYSDRKTADAVTEAETGAAGIAFSKEQQWKISFANMPVTERVLHESLTVSATLRPRAGGEAIIAAPAAGLLRAASTGFPQIGMTVKAGQVLGYFVPRLGGETDAATLQLAVERARIEAEEARQALTRLEELFKAEAIAEKRVREARSRNRLAMAELDAAQHRSNTYSGGSGGIPLKSPINGTVVAVGAGAGAAVLDGQTLIHIADLGKLWLEVRIPESELGKITQPSGAFFHLEGEDNARVLEAGRNARLVAYGGLVNKDTRTVPAIFEIDNPEGRLRAGMNLRVGLYTGRSEKILAIPASSIVDENGITVVFVQKEGESFERRVVEPGTRDGEWVGLRSGISNGERIVSIGAYQVRLAATAPAALGHGHAH